MRRAIVSAHTTVVGWTGELRSADDGFQGAIFFETRDELYDIVSSTYGPDPCCIEFKVDSLVTGVTTEVDIG